MLLESLDRPSMAAASASQAPAPAPAPVPALSLLDDAAVSSMSVAAVFDDYGGKITSLDFHRSEDLLVTASRDDSIRLYSTAAATSVAPLLYLLYLLLSIFPLLLPLCSLEKEISCSLFSATNRIASPR